MSSPDRQELIRNAVVFLGDPKVIVSSCSCLDRSLRSFIQAQASPLAQRIQFLEAKGLTPPEIDIAIKQASLTTPQQTPYAPGYSQNYSIVGPAQPQRWDWRDYFACRPQIS